MFFERTCWHFTLLQHMYLTNMFIAGYLHVFFVQCLALRGLPRQLLMCYTPNLLHAWDFVHLLHRSL